MPEKAKKKVKFMGEPLQFSVGFQGLITKFKACGVMYTMG